MPSKKLKNDGNFGRNWVKSWEINYFFEFYNKKCTCLICRQKISSIKEYNLKIHYATNHDENINHIKANIEMIT